MIGQVHSIESFGTVDGPGIRLVVFLQGCPLRCAYCHNPDTWDKQGGKQTEVGEILSLYRKNRSFYEKGGITVTGGEPLLQAEFVKELFAGQKKREFTPVLIPRALPLTAVTDWTGCLHIPIL